MTIDPTNASRSSSESSFLQHTCNKTTLEVHNNTLAQKLVFADKKVKAVIVASGGASASENLSYILSARKEVIVSAGAVQSPQFLMMSGIGPGCCRGAGIPEQCLWPAFGCRYQSARVREATPDVSKQIVLYHTERAQ